MASKAIFLDRDGTINVEKHYLHRIEDFEFIPGAVNALKRLQDAGYLLFIMTNQSGIAKGYYSEEDFLKLNDWMLGELKSQGVTISKVYYCPHLPDARVSKYRTICDCRKPALGMFRKAITEFDIDVGKSYAIGDKIRDCSLCNETDCKGFLVGNNEKPEVINSAKNGIYRNINYAFDLSVCADIILE